MSEQLVKMQSNIVTLSNGKRVANFSNPTTIQFSDRTVLYGVNENIREKLKVRVDSYTKDNGDTVLNYSLSPDIRMEMESWISLWNSNKVDVVFIPYSMREALKDLNYNIEDSPFRCLPSKDMMLNAYPIDKQIL